MEKTVTIFVEGTPHEWPKDEKISFDQVVIWVYPDYSPSDGRTYTVGEPQADKEPFPGRTGLLACLFPAWLFHILVRCLGIRPAPPPVE